MVRFLSVKQTLGGGNIQLPTCTYSKCASLAISTLMHSKLPALAALWMGVSPVASLKKTEKNGMMNNRNPSNYRWVKVFIYLFIYVLETTYLLVCISTSLQQPKQAESLTSACREMRRRLSVSRTIQTIHSKPAFKKITRTVLLNGDSMKPRFNQNTYDFLKARYEMIFKFS